MALLLAAGTVQASDYIVNWGYNGWGQCDVPSPNSGFVAVAAYAGHSLALREDGSVEAWGDNFYGQLDVPSPNTDFAAISTAYEHGIGLKADGSFVAWGANYYGQLDIPEPNSGYIDVAAGYQHNYALRADSTIAAWGDNAHVQLDITDYGPYKMIAGFGWHFSGLKESATGLEPSVPETAGELSLISAFPNPFDSHLTVSFSCSGMNPVQLEVFDLAGRSVFRQSTVPSSDGPQTVLWDGTTNAGQPLPSGVYTVRLTAGDKVSATRVLRAG